LLAVNINEFTTGITAGSAPRDIVAGPDGNVWFTEQSGNRIGMITPQGVVAEYAIPTADSTPVGITVGPDGNLWFAEYTGNRIGTIAPDGTITEYLVPTKNAGPHHITTGPDGNLWFTEFGAGQIGRITPDGQTIDEFPLPTKGSEPYEITVGPDANLWFAEYGASQLGRMTPDGQKLTEFPLPTKGSQPTGITAGLDGNVWFTESGADQVGFMSTDGQTIQEFSTLTKGSQPWAITVGPDGNYWFSEFGVNQVGAISPDGSQLMEYPTTQTGYGPVGITLGPDGTTLWFGYPGNAVGEIVPNATLSAGGTTVQAVEGGDFVGVVGSFTDDLAIGQYAITILWGDGSVSDGSFQPNDAGGYDVSGEHVYAEEGSYSVEILVSYLDNTSPALARSSAMVADAPLSATGTTFNGVEGNAFSGTVATFTDGNPNATADEFSVTITWDDGQNSAGTLTALGGGQFAVSGSHVYAEENSTGYTVGVSISDVMGGSTARAASTAVIADAPLSATGATVNGVEGTALSGVVATFTDGNPNAVGADFTATIQWGDGQNSAGQVYSLGTGIWYVSGSHVYAEENTTGYVVGVSIRDVGGSTASATSRAVIADAPLSATGTTFNGVEGSTFSGAVATLTDGNPNATAGEFSVTITWGDGQNSAGTLTALGGGRFTVGGSHVYAEENSTGYTVGVSIRDIAGGNTAGATSTAVIADAPLSATGTTFNGVEGTTFSGAVATFTDANPNATAGEFSVNITWGDGQNSAGTVTPLGGGRFNVSGSHTYADENLSGYTVGVSIRDVAGGSTASAASTAVIADAPLSATGTTINGAVNETLTQVVATFTDGNPGAPASDFTTTITWGDGGSSGGTVTALGGGRFSVTGSHLYNRIANFTVRTDIRDRGNSTASANSTAVVIFQGVLTQRNDLNRDGDNLQETRLTQANVNTGSFGRLWTLPVIGTVYAQPLYVSAVSTAAGVKNLLIVPTMHNMVYAFDGDSSAQTPIWMADVGSAYAVKLPDPNVGGSGYQDIHGEVGVVSAPVVDPTAGVVYVVAAKKMSTTDYHHTIYKLSLSNGAVLASHDINGNVFVFGTGAGSDGTFVHFRSDLELQRAGLTLANNHVYVAFASYGDNGPYHGWVLGFNANTLATDYVFNDTADGEHGGIWQSGAGMAVDSSGNLYFMTGNGTSDPNWQSQGHRPELGECFVKLSPTLQVLDWFMAKNYQSLNNSDADLGSAGPVLLPDSGLVVGGGKEGKIYTLNQNSLGHYTSDDSGASQAVQVTGVQNYSNSQNPPNATHHIHGTPVLVPSATGDPRLDVWGENDWGRSLDFTGTNLFYSTVRMNNNAMPTKVTPAFVEFNGRLVIAWNDPATGRIIPGYANSDPTFFQQGVPFAPISTQPAALATGNGVVLMAVRTPQRNIGIWRSTDGVSWTLAATLSGDTTDQGPALAFGNGRFVLAHAGDNSHIYVQTSTNGVNWTGTTNTGEDTNTQPALYFDGSRFYLSWAGTNGGQLNVKVSLDGVNYSQKNTYRAQTSSFAPRLTKVGTTYYMTWRGDDGQHKLNVVGGPDPLNFPDTTRTQAFVEDGSAAGAVFTTFHGQAYLAWPALNSPAGNSTNRLVIAPFNGGYPMSGANNPFLPTYTAFQDYPGMPGGMMSLSANGTNASSAVLWSYMPLDGDANTHVIHGVLRAFNPVTMTELWNSELRAGRADSVQVTLTTGVGGGYFPQFGTPMVANGKVFLGTGFKPDVAHGIYTGASYVVVYGLRGTSPGGDGSPDTPRTPNGDGVVPVAAPVAAQVPQESNPSALVSSLRMASAEALPIVAQPAASPARPVVAVDSARQDASLVSQPSGRTPAAGAANIAQESNPLRPVDNRALDQVFADLAWPVRTFGPPEPAAARLRRPAPARVADLLEIPDELPI
jgi:streptogramin lyase